MVASRILFLATYSTTMDYKKLINEHALATNAIYVSKLLGSVCDRTTLTAAATISTCSSIPGVWEGGTVANG